MVMHLEERYPSGSITDINLINQSGKGRKRNSYDMKTKLEAVGFAESNGKRAAARKFGVEVKRIREWCSKKAELTYKASTGDGQKRKRLDGGGRKPLSENLEDVILEWFFEMKDKGDRISMKAIGTQAELVWKSFQTTMDSESNQQLGNVNTREIEFKASRGWVSSFLKRHGLSLR